MNYEAMKKKVAKDGDKEVYLLGRDSEGMRYWLVEPSWDCDWYWGFGYMQSYEKDKEPNRATDTDAFTHFDYCFLKGEKTYLGAFRDFFEETPLSESEIWTLMELMKSAYTLKTQSELIHRGGSHITSNPLSDLLKDTDYYNKINKVLLPQIFEEIKKILKGE